MPRKNIVKYYAPDQTYHIYSRGVAKQIVFYDEQDFGYFISLFKRYLSPDQSLNKARMPYPNYAKVIELHAFCLMPNHFHLLIHQHESESITFFMKSLVTSYSMYFNKRYVRTGPVFESSFKASLVNTDSYLLHISRYIHLNPKNWQKYPYSSIDFYLNNKSALWLSTDKITGQFENLNEYRAFLKDYEDYESSIEDLAWELADK